LDTTRNKSVIMNGMKIPGVMTVGINADVDDGITRVTLTMCIRKDSLVWDKDAIRFHTISDLVSAAPMEPQKPRIRRPRVQE
jgi:hypothetical protein